MAKWGDDAEAPKPDPRIGQAALLQGKLGAEWLDFAKDAFKTSTKRLAEIDALTKRFTEAQLSASEADRKRYEEVFKPLEDQFVADAQSYDSPERQAAEAARAGADVETAAAAERAASERRMASMGINPTSGRYAGIERATGLGTALARAGAENDARAAVRDRATALKGAAIDIGRGLPASSTAAGQAALGATLGANSAYNASTGIMGSGYSGAIGGYGSQANTLTNLYNSTADVWGMQQKLNQSNALGVGQFLGTGLGLILSSKKAKTEKRPIPEGEALDAVREMPVESWRYAPGIGGPTRHVGPYAEDFAAETGSGDGTAIPAQDAIGITMKAVQDLDAKVERIATAVGLGGRGPGDQPGTMRRAA